MTAHTESRKPKEKRITLPRHQACLFCRTRKKKCDTQIPRCGRCVRYDFPCYSQVALAPRKRTNIYEERILGLELQLALMSKVHSHNLISQFLWEKLRVLGDPSNKRSGRWVSSHKLAFWPHDSIPITAASGNPWGRVVNEELEIGFTPTIPREMIGQMVRTWAPAFDGRPLPASFSLWMIRLFLPHRIHLFAFGIELPLFFTALSHPPEDPRSLHPALLNAIYLATCWIVGGEFDFLKRHFLAQTRYYLGKALETRDRLMHFLWANVILGSFFALEGRMDEARLTISSCLEFAVACGLDVVHYRNTTPPAQTTLLPPPTNRADVVDRLRFSSTIYVLDRTLAMITGTSSAFSGDKGPLTRPSVGSESEALAWGAFSVHTEILQKEMDALLCDPSISPAVTVMVLYERIEQLARRADRLSPTEMVALVSIYAPALDTLGGSLPPQLDPWGIEQAGTLGMLSPIVIYRHISHHACVMLLYSLTAKTDFRAREKVVKAARAIAELVPLIRGKRGLKPIHASLLLMLHMANAARVFASYISTPEVKTSTELFSMCCESLGMLVDLLDDASAIFPAWAHVLQILRELFPQAPDNDRSSTPASRAPAPAPTPDIHVLPSSN